MSNLKNISWNGIIIQEFKVVLDKVQPSLKLYENKAKRQTEWLKGSYSTGSLFTVEEPQFPQGVGVFITVKKGGSEAEIGGRETEVKMYN